MEKAWSIKSKLPMLIIGALVTLFLVFQTYAVMSTNKSETQTYKVVRSEIDFEIRFYPAVVMATITSTVKTYKELGNSGFKKLANYIFGGNQEKKQIAMTSPVHMDITDSLSSMSFVMPANYTKENLPLPNDPSVKIDRTFDEYVAVIKFAGFASEKDIKFYNEKLKNALIEKGISYYGHFRFLGYNPPYQLVGRKNEIIISVNWNEKI
jgi:SOUL heme-binding protein